MRREWGAEGSAVIAFGGSYGGMLASWMRILYPSSIDGGNSYLSSGAFLYILEKMKNFYMFSCFTSFTISFFGGPIN
jgi:hypothetical protein